MFKLTNARGETVDINTPSLRSYTPTGLGLQITNSYSPYETYFIPTKSVLSQGIMQVYMKFGDIESQSYQSFSDFAQFLAYQPYTLEYDFDDNTYYRDARLQSLTKTEIGGSTIDAFDRLNEIFTLEFINNWYNNKTAEYKSYDPDPNLGTYGKIYGNQIADTSIQINSQGQQNKLVNTEFSPDLSGWVPDTGYEKATDIPSYNGSNVIHITTTNTGYDYMRQSVAVTQGQILSFSTMMKFAPKTPDNSTVYWRYSINFYKASGGSSLGITYGNQNFQAFDWTLQKSENIVAPADAAYVTINYYMRGAGESWLSQPMLVFDTTVGDYVQGLEYNHVATPAYTYVYGVSQSNGPHVDFALTDDAQLEK